MKVSRLFFEVILIATVGFFTVLSFYAAAEPTHYQARELNSEAHAKVMAFIEPVKAYKRLEHLPDAQYNAELDRVSDLWLAGIRADRIAEFPTEITVWGTSEGVVRQILVAQIGLVRNLGGKALRQFRAGDEEAGFRTMTKTIEISQALRYTDTTNAATMSNLVYRLIKSSLPYIRHQDRESLANLRKKTVDVFANTKLADALRMEKMRENKSDNPADSDLDIVKKFQDIVINSRPEHSTFVRLGHLVRDAKSKDKRAFYATKVTWGYNTQSQKILDALIAGQEPQLDILGSTSSFHRDDSGFFR